MSCSQLDEVVTGGVGWLATRVGDEDVNEGAGIECTDADVKDDGSDVFLCLSGSLVFFAVFLH